MIAWARGPLAASAVVCVASFQPGAFVTAPQRDPMPGPPTSASADVSANGRMVAFESRARLVPADTNDWSDIYVLDLETRRVTLESAGQGLAAATAHPRLSGDGRFLVFEAASTTAGDAYRGSSIVLCDRSNATSKILTTGVDGSPVNGGSRDPDISDDGQVVAFASNATNLIAGPDANGNQEDVYAFDVRTGTIQRVSVDGAGTQSSTGISMSPRLSGDGRVVAFTSSAPLSLATPGRDGGASARRQVYVRDLVALTTLPVSGDGRSVPNGDSWGPAISSDGRWVAFVSHATNLGAGSRNRTADVFLRNLRTGALTLVSRGMEGEAASGTSEGPAVSADGSFVAFQSDASNLVCRRRCPPASEDINLVSDVFVFDRARSLVVRASEDETAGWMEASRGPALDASGRVLAFASRHPTDPLDRGDDYDLFVKVPEGIGSGP